MQGEATPQGAIYRIRVRGHLGQEWSEWFSGMAVTVDANGDTLLTGPVADQAALFGVLKRVRDAGLPLLAVNCIEAALEANSEANPADQSGAETETTGEQETMSAGLMQAHVRNRYGGPEVLELRTVQRPTPKDDEVLIRVRAVAANAADWHLLRGDPALLRMMYGLRTPKITILGADVAGTVEAAGSAVTEFAPGDAVFGDLAGCGFGGYAEYACAQARFLAPKPVRLSFAEAAAVPMAAVTALQGLRNVGHIQAGQKVLINGASGGVGTYAVQLAKAFGAEVTAVCSTRNVEQARALGADHVIDYTREDFARNGQRYDLILAANGQRSIGDYRRALTPQGRYVMAGGSTSQMMQALLLGPVLSLASGKKLGNVMAQPNADDLRLVAELIEAGKVKPVIDRCYEFAEVPAALRYMEEGHARGKVVVTVG